MYEAPPEERIALANAQNRIARLECLKLASELLRFGYETPEEIVARAKAYEDFIDGTHHHAMPKMEDITGVTNLMRGR